MSFNKSKSNQGVSKATNARASEIYKAAQGAANAPIPGAIGDAQGMYGAGTQAGRTALGALSGDPNAARQFMNPYQQQVIDQMNQQFGVQNQMTTNAVNDAATRAGAFGGSRQGVAQGVALADNARTQGMQMAGLLNQGFEGAMGRAGQVAGMGFDAAGAGANLGMTAGNRDLWRLNTLQRGYNPIQTGSSSSIGFSVPRGG